MKTAKPKGSSVVQLSGKRQSKADFIRGLPLDLPIQQVIRRARDTGLIISGEYVRDVRAGIKKAKEEAVQPRPDRHQVQ